MFFFFYFWNFELVFFLGFVLFFFLFISVFVTRTWVGMRSFALEFTIITQFEQFKQTYTLFIAYYLFLIDCRIGYCYIWKTRYNRTVQLKKIGLQFIEKYDRKHLKYLRLTIIVIEPT